MSNQITDATTQAEVNQIHNFYKDEDGRVDYSRIARDMESGRSEFDREDLMTAYVVGTGDMPAAMVDDPDAYPWLWEEESVKNLEQLGDLYASSRASIEDVLTSGDVEGRSDDGLFDEVSSIIDGIDLESPGSDAGSAGDTLDLFNVPNLKEVISGFLKNNGPQLAVLMATAFSFKRSIEGVQESALDVIDDSSDELQDLMDQLEALDPDDPDAQYESSVISQQMNIVSTVISTMNQFIQTAQEALNDQIQLASNLEQSQNQTRQQIIGQIGR